MPATRPALLKPVREAAKAFAFRHTSLGRRLYPYNVEPIQLAALVNELERLKGVAGNVVEIGVARGMTTRFVCEHIRKQGLDGSLSYFALDTYESFTDEDLAYEVSQRGKSMFDLKGFDYNDYEVWQRNFAAFPFVRAIKSDCSLFDFQTIAPIKLAFLDVDLYLPTKKTLPKLYEAMVPGGAILVDDVLDASTYDGAYQAYMEFCQDSGLPPQVIGNKCGVILKV